MFCRKCGNSVEEGSTSCPRCGNESLSETIPSIFKTKRAGAKSIKPFLFTLPFWGGVVCLGLAFFIGKKAGLLGLALATIGFAAVAFAYIYSLVCLHRCWSVIKDYNARTTPGKAVGYLFIPFFSIYWVFVALRGLAQDANEFSRQAGSGTRISENLSLSAAILSIIPYLNILLAPIIISILISHWANFYNSAPNPEKLSYAVDLHQTRRKYTSAIAASLFVSIALIGLYAAGGISKFAEFRRVSGPVAEMQAECEIIKEAEESYHAAHGKYLQTLHPETDLRKYGIKKLSTSAIVLSDGSFYIISMESHKTPRKLRYNSSEGKAQIE